MAEQPGVFSDIMMLHKQIAATCRGLYASLRDLTRFGRPLKSEAPRLAPFVEASFYPEGVILLHRKRARLFRANATGARIVASLMEHFDPAEIATRLMNEYSIPQPLADRGVSQFLRDLNRQGFLAREWRS